MQDEHKRLFFKRYRRLLIGMHVIARLFPQRLSQPLAARWARLTAPVLAQRESLTRCMRRYLPAGTDVEAAWRAYVGYWGVAENCFRLMPSLGGAWLRRRVSVRGEQVLREAHAGGRGVLVLTYHAHFNALFSALLGMMSYRTYVIAKDPVESPMFSRFPREGRSRYRKVEQHMNGGRMIYVSRGRTDWRAIHRAFRDGSVVTTSIDVSGQWAGKRRARAQVLGAVRNWPTGIVEVALGQGVPIIIGHLRWTGGADFEAVFRPVAGATPQGVMDEYCDVLGDLLLEHPGLWQAWPSLPGCAGAGHGRPGRRLDRS